jgi:antitoxin component YwqK of YwqJK toxin-antitoxin module
MIQGYYENNMLHGPYTTYHPNGQVQTKGQYKNDLQHGVWDFFDENGNLINTEKYQLKE